MGTMAEAKGPLRGVLRPRVQPLQHVRTIPAPIKFQRLGELTVENLRQPDQRLKIELGPFGHHAIEYSRPCCCHVRSRRAKKFLSEFLV